jgi:hypothetical protein
LWHRQSRLGRRDAGEGYDFPTAMQDLSISVLAKNDRDGKDSSDRSAEIA